MKIIDLSKTIQYNAGDPFFMKVKLSKPTANRVGSSERLDFVSFVSSISVGGPMMAKEVHSTTSRRSWHLRQPRWEKSQAILIIGVVLW